MGSLYADEHPTQKLVLKDNWPVAGENSVNVFHGSLSQASISVCLNVNHFGPDLFRFDESAVKHLHAH